MKVLFASNEQFLPLSGGGSIGNLKIVEKFVEGGHDVTVATPFYLGVEESARVESEYNIRLRPFSPFFLHKNVAMRGPKYLLYGALYTFHLAKLLAKGGYDVLFVRNCLLGFPALLLRPLTKAAYVLSMTDFLTGFLYNNRRYPRWAVNLMFWAERYITRFFDQVFVITPQMRRMLVEGGCHPSRINVSYDGVDTGIFDPARVSESDVAGVRRQYGVGGKLVLFHGTIDDHAGAKLRAVIRLVGKSNADLTFVLLGQGKRYDDLKLELESERVRFPGYVPYESIPKYVAAADVGIIPYENNFNSDIIITLKLLEYLAMGLPVVSTNLRSVRELFGVFDYVRLTTSDEEFADGVIEMSGGGKSQEAVNHIRANYNWDMVTAAIVEAVERKYGGGP